MSDHIPSDVAQIQREESLEVSEKLTTITEDVAEEVQVSAHIVYGKLLESVDHVLYRWAGKNYSFGEFGKNNVWWWIIMAFRYLIGFTILLLVIAATVLILDSNNSTPSQAFGTGSSGDPPLNGCNLNGIYYKVDSRNCAFHVGAGMYGGTGCSGLYSGDMRLVVKPDCIFTMWWYYES
jgi:hypothetical protein